MVSNFFSSFSCDVKVGRYSYVYNYSTSLYFFKHQNVRFVVSHHVVSLYWEVPQDFHTVVFQNRFRVVVVPLFVAGLKVVFLDKQHVHVFAQVIVTLDILGGCKD